MPFFIADQDEQFKNSLLLDQTKPPVTRAELEAWNIEYNKRKDILKQLPQIDMNKHNRSIEIRKNTILNLLPKPYTTEDYLGIHFICDFKKKGATYEKFSILLSHSKKVNGVFKAIKLLRPNGLEISNEKYLGYLTIYKNYVNEVRRTDPSLYLTNETTAIYHTVEDFLKIKDLITTKRIQFSLIKDLHKTTVIIADDNFDIEDPFKNLPTTSLDPAVHDHGTGCCKIER